MKSRDSIFNTTAPSLAKYDDDNDVDDDDAADDDVDGDDDDDDDDGSIFDTTAPSHYTVRWVSLQ